MAALAGCQAVRLSASSRVNSLKRSASVRQSAGRMATPRSRGALCVAAAAKNYKITLLPGDGIGPEIMSVAKDILVEVGSQRDIAFDFTECLVGGAAIDATGIPLPAETLATCQASDAVLLAAIGGYKWDTLPADVRPEQGLLGLRAGLGVFANLRPANILPQLIDASSLKREIVEGTDIMVIRELIGGIYFGKPKGFGVDEDGNRTGFNTMVYSVPEIERIARVGFETARKRSNRLCSVEKSNVLEVSQLWKEIVTKVHEEEYPRRRTLPHVRRQRRDADHPRAHAV